MHTEQGQEQEHVHEKETSVVYTTLIVAHAVPYLFRLCCLKMYVLHAEMIMCNVGECAPISLCSLTQILQTCSSTYMVNQHLGP